MRNSQVAVVITGAKGRMGLMLLQACENIEGVRVTGLVERPGHPDLGSVMRFQGSEIPLSKDLESSLVEGSILIDFTSPFATLKAAEICSRKKSKMVIGTTGFDSAQLKQLENLSSTVPMVLSPNMSVGVNVLFKVGEWVAKILGESYDIEIVEMHHRNKKDAPSGTALGIARSVAKGRGIEFDKNAVYGRRGLTEIRKGDAIGMHSLRGGSVVGDHSVVFAGESERIVLQHIAENRVAFAVGAIRAARFIAAKTSGLYDMSHVLGLNGV